MMEVYLVSGGGGPHAIYGAEIVRALAETVHGEASFGHFSTLEQFHAAFRARRGNAFVGFLEAPDQRVGQLLVRSDMKVAVFHDRIESTTAFLMEHHRLDFRGALRYASLSASCIACLADAGRANVFPSLPPRMQFSRFVNLLCMFYGIEPQMERIAQIFRRLGLHPAESRIDMQQAMGVKFPATQRIERRLDALPAFERRILSEVASGYDALAERQSGEAAVSWPPGFCLSGDRPDDYLRNPIDLVGPARLLAYGPYLHLPQGVWAMELRVEVEGNHSGNRLEISIMASGEVRAAQEFEIPASGGVEARLPFHVEAPRAAIEIYVRTKEGAIEGALTLRSIEMTRLAPE